MFTSNVSSVLVTMALVAMLALASLAQSQPAPKQQQPPADFQIDQITGKLVNLCAYLKNDDGDDNAAADRKPADNQPIALIEDRAALAELVAGDRAYLIVFDPDDPVSSRAYEQARRMLGQTVELTGRTMQRGDMRAVEVRRIEPVAEAADAQPG